MTARRPYVEIAGTPPKLKELVDGDDLIVPRAVTPAGFVHVDPALVDYQARHRGLKQWIVTPGTNGWERYGFSAAPTTTGTLTSADTTTAALVRVTTAGGGTDKGEVKGNFTQTKLNRLPHLSTIIKTPASLANIRLWCGLASNTLWADNDNDAAEHAAFRFSSATDSNWRAHTSDGGASHNGDSGIVVAVSTEYLLEVVIVGGVIRFLINGVDVHSTSANMPISSTALGPYTSITELAAGAKTLDVGLISLWTR